MSVRSAINRLNSARMSVVFTIAVAICIILTGGYALAATTLSLNDTKTYSAASEPYTITPPAKGIYTIKTEGTGAKAAWPQLTYGTAKIKQIGGSRFGRNGVYYLYYQLDANITYNLTFSPAPTVGTLTLTWLK